MRELYSFAVKPTGAIFISACRWKFPSTRLHAARSSGFKFYEAGLDLGMTEDPDESFRLFQGRIVEEYEKIVPEFGLPDVIDATQPIEIPTGTNARIGAFQTRARETIAGGAMKVTNGVILPGMELSDLVGKLIVIEGTDGVGRSTQIALLKEWLEQKGHAVLDTGLSRSGSRRQGN